MTIAHQFDYVRPQSLEEALEILGSHGGDARVLAGGTDLVAWLRDEMITPGLVVDIKRIEGLDEIRTEPDVVVIGSLVTFSDLLGSKLVAERLPLITEMAGTVGSVGIRNRATLVGNICSAVPSCDAGPALLVHEARVEVIGESGVRRVPMTEWFRGPRQTAASADEIVTGVAIPFLEGRHGSAYVRLSRYRGEDLAQAGVAVLVTADDRYRVAFGAVASTPRRAPGIEAILDGKTLDSDIVTEAVSLVSAEIAPITDIRATKEYRLAMSEVMLRRGLKTAFERREGQGPSYGARLI